MRRARPPLPLQAAACLLAALCGCGGGSGPAARADIVVLATFQAADVVLGQPIFAFNDANQGYAMPDAQTLHAPGMCSGSPFYLPDVINHRVLGYRGEPYLNHLAASFALGQPGLAFAIPGVGPASLDRPLCAAVEDGRLFVSDTGNQRVLVWNTLPDDDAAPADLALGQPDLFTRGPGLGAASFADPAGLAVGGGRLVVADRAAHRVLVWHTIPGASGAPADLVLGQDEASSAALNAGRLPDAATLSDPFAAWTDGTRLVVADRGNHRVLVWHAFPSASGQPADLVLGQPDFVQTSGRVGASGMFLPSDVASNGTQLFVADAGNHRVLVWDAFPTVNGQPADHVLGQSDFEHNAPNDADQDGQPEARADARTLQSMDAVLTVCVDGDRLYVGDTGNHRVLIFETR